MSNPSAASVFSITIEVGKILCCRFLKFCKDLYDGGISEDNTEDFPVVSSFESFDP